MLDITREDAGLLIGRRGQTLRHVQMLLNTIVSRSLGHYVPLRIDVEGYLQRHIYRLQQLALRAADHVRRRRRAITLDPMSPADRRIVHMTLADDATIVTGSTGQGENRRVTIQQAPRPAATRRAPQRAEPPPPPPDADEDYDEDDDDYIDDEGGDLDGEYDDEDYDEDDFEEDEFDEDDYDEEGEPEPGPRA